MTGIRREQCANMGPTWGRQDPGGPPAGPMNLAIWEVMSKVDGIT